MIKQHEDVTLIGVDCAVNAKNTGIAVGRIVDGLVRIEEIEIGQSDPAAYVVTLVANSQPALIALDAPLGWPDDLGQTLASHRAGMPLPADPNRLFRRETDRFVKRRIGKQSLDVGADRIARTAHAAIRMLASIRLGTRLDIPLAWNANVVEKAACIEVYPAATLEALAISSRGYKGKRDDDKSAREKIVGLLRGILKLEEPARKKAVNSDDGLDAAICCLAAADLLRGNAIEPEDTASAQKEGWIWVRGPQ